MNVDNDEQKITYSTKIEMLISGCGTLFFEEDIHIKPVERNRQWKKRSIF
jgi:hypothetical protein